MRRLDVSECDTYLGCFFVEEFVLECFGRSVFVAVCRSSQFVWYLSFGSLVSDRCSRSEIGAAGAPRWGRA